MSQQPRHRGAPSPKDQAARHRAVPSAPVTEPGNIVPLADLLEIHPTPGPASHRAGPGPRYVAKAAALATGTFMVVAAGVTASNSRAAQTGPAPEAADKSSTSFGADSFARVDQERPAVVVKKAPPKPKPKPVAKPVPKPAPPAVIAPAPVQPVAPPAPAVQVQPAPVAPPAAPRIIEPAPAPPVVGAPRPAPPVVQPPAPKPVQPAPVAPSNRGAIIAAAARAQLGAGQDCTMLATRSIAAVGVNFHGWPAGYLSLGRTVSPAEAQPGDLAYYQNGGMGLAHIAVYVGNGQAVHGGWNGNQTVLFSVNVGSGPVFIRV